MFFFLLLVIFSGIMAWVNDVWMLLYVTDILSSCLWPCQKDGLVFATCGLSCQKDCVWNWHPSQQNEQCGRILLPASTLCLPLFSEDSSCQVCFVMAFLKKKKKKDMWSSSHLAASVVLSGVKTKELFLNYSPLHKKANAEVVFLWTLFFSKEKQTRLDMTLWIESKGLFLISVRFLDPRFLYMTFPPSLFLLSFIFSLMTVTLLFL